MACIPSTSWFVDLTVAALFGALVYGAAFAWHLRRQRDAARLAHALLLREVQRWRPEVLRVMLAQRWTRNATGFEPTDPQRPILSAAALALLLAPDIETVAREVEGWIVLPHGPDGKPLAQRGPNQIEHPTAESQAAEQWRQVVAEARDLAAERVHTFMPDGAEPPPLCERLWRFLSGHSPVRQDNWPAAVLERTRRELLARAQLHAVDAAANRGHPRASTGDELH